MSANVNDWLWFVTLAYPLVFVIFGVAYGREYFRTIPDEKEMHDFDRQENIAFVLAGFAIAALSVVIGFSSSDLASKEPLIDFLSIGFLSEIITGFLSHYRFNHGYKYFGFVAQYTGMLGIITGFFSFFVQAAPGSLTLFFIYYAGLAAFLLLTFPELSLYWKYWKAIRNAKGHSRKMGDLPYT